ncbi:MAG: hypothetical protein EZS28_051023 [Streblomastix strix]|uniref:Uncharacterized protein n=1 Tax=Streblomastix strix TaxID=222440 RepID=A0A5J4T7K6_9EUKA|nr:MAG: hypothetical protein EZS28_051023 [Streblomastix strix]
MLIHPIPQNWRDQVADQFAEFIVGVLGFQVDACETGVFPLVFPAVFLEFRPYGDDCLCTIGGCYNNND